MQSGYPSQRFKTTNSSLTAGLPLTAACLQTISLIYSANLAIIYVALFMSIELFTPICTSVFSVSALIDKRLGLLMNFSKTKEKRNSIETLF